MAPIESEIEFSLYNGPRGRPHSVVTEEHPRVTKVLALALFFQDMIASGTFDSFLSRIQAASVEQCKGLEY